MNRTTIGNRGKCFGNHIHPAFTEAECLPLQVEFDTPAQKHDKHDGRAGDRGIAVARGHASQFEHWRVDRGNTLAELALQKMNGRREMH